MKNPDWGILRSKVWMATHKVLIAIFYSHFKYEMEEAYRQGGEDTLRKLYLSQVSPITNEMLELQRNVFNTPNSMRIEQQGMTGANRGYQQGAITNALADFVIPNCPHCGFKEGSVIEHPCPSQLL